MSEQQINKPLFGFPLPFITRRGLPNEDAIVAVVAFFLIAGGEERLSSGGFVFGFFLGVCLAAVVVVGTAACSCEKLNEQDDG